MAQPPIPNKAQWESQMNTWGRVSGDKYTDGSLPTDDNKLAQNYYDGTWVFQQIYDYRKNKLGLTESEWLGYATQAKLNYQDWYLHSFTASGYRAFPHGIYQRWLRYGLEQDKTDLVTLAQTSDYARDTTPLIWTAGANNTPTQEAGSREAAYALQCYIYAEKVGESVRPKRNGYVDQIIDHFNQWVVVQNTDFVRPFMMALSAHTLIELTEHEPTHARVTDGSILSMLRTAFQWAWDHCWLPVESCFMYTDRNVSTGGQEPAPDLNLLIAPVYAWLYNQTGELKWMDYGDQIFSGGVLAQSNLHQGKQFNQQYRWSVRYVELREADPFTSPPIDDPPIDPPPIDPPPPPGLNPGNVSKLYTVAGPRLYLPAKNRSYIQKFQQNGWTTFKQKKDAGFPLWIQPTELTAQFIEIIDIGTLISAGTQVVLAYTALPIAGIVTITPTLSVSSDGTSWTDYAGLAQIFASNFRYVKIKLDAVATDLTGVSRIEDMRLKLLLKEKRDGGSGSAEATDYTGEADPLLKGTLVNFNKTFLDINQLIVTARYQSLGGGDLPIAYHNFQDVPNPTGFRVFVVKKSDGTVIDGDFDWEAKGA